MKSITPPADQAPAATPSRSGYIGPKRRTTAKQAILGKKCRPPDVAGELCGAENVPRLALARYRLDVSTDHPPDRRRTGRAGRNTGRPLAILSLCRRQSGNPSPQLLTGEANSDALRAERGQAKRQNGIRYPPTLWLQRYRFSQHRNDSLEPASAGPLKPFQNNRSRLFLGRCREHSGWQISAPSSSRIACTVEAAKTFDRRSQQGSRLRRREAKADRLPATGRSTSDAIGATHGSDVPHNCMNPAAGRSRLSSGVS